ncbi:MAG: HEAT repeat domain-containing protein, partial [Candidatus Hodarchaeales archaeon]
MEKIIGCLNDDRRKIRYNSIIALACIGDKRAVKPLVKRLEDGDWAVSEAAARALGKLGDKRAVKPLVKRLEDGDWAVRSTAALALGKLGDKRAVKPL